MGKSGKELDQGIAQLDPKLHTLGLIYLLYARCSHPFDDGLEFLQRCQNLFNQASLEQARMELKRLVRIAHKFTSLATELQVPMRAILPLEKAIAIVAQEDNQLTAIHADWLQVSLLARAYTRAGRVLSTTTVLKLGDVRVNGFTQSDYLRFWYYGGLVWTGLKDYGRAITYFEQCFSAPAVALSAPALEAYKKHILVSLIHRGQSDPKRSAASLMMRNMKAMSGAYVEFSNAYTTKDMVALQKIASDHHETFTKDKNWGLVNQCLESLGDRQIRGLTQTYLTMSLETLAKDANLASKNDAQKRLLSMVEAGTINAKINEKDGMVAFAESSEQYDDARTLATIDNSVRQSIHLGSLLRQLDDQIASSADFIQKTTMPQEGRGFGGGAGMGGDAEMMGLMAFEGGFLGN